MKFNYKPFLFVVVLVGLIALQSKVLMPFIYDIVSSDLFLKDEDESITDTMADEMLGHAFSQCNNYIAKDLESDELSVAFASNPINAWSLGDNQYVVNGDVDLTPLNAQPFTRRYVCRIKYSNDSRDYDEVNDPDNWSIDGVSGLDEL